MLCIFFGAILLVRGCASFAINTMSPPVPDEELYFFQFSTHLEAHRSMVWPGRLRFAIIAERVDGLKPDTDALEVCFSSSTEGDEMYKFVEMCVANATRFVLGKSNAGFFVIPEIENGSHTVIGALFHDGRMVSKAEAFEFQVNLLAREPDIASFECKAVEGNGVAGLLLRVVAAEDGLVYGTHRNADYLRRLTVEGGVVGTVNVVHEKDDPRLVGERARGGGLEEQVNLLERGLQGGCGDFNILDGGSEGVADELEPTFVVLDGSARLKGDLVQLVSKWYSTPSVRMLVVSNYSLCEVLKTQPAPPEFQGGSTILTSDDELVVVKEGGKGENSESDLKSKNAIVVVSMSHPGVSYDARPWTPLVMKRIERYAKKCGSDLVVYNEIDTAGCDSSDFRLCAMLMKLKAVKRGLEDYDRVMLLDDTALVRDDTPNLFQVVPKDLVGGVYEIYRGREAEERFLGRISEFYGLAVEGQGGGGGHVMNTGVMVLSKAHHFDMLFNNTDWMEGQEQYNVRLNAELLGDQGYINAMMLKEWGWSWGGKVMDLGLRFNFVGSFENLNRMKVDFRNVESYIVHATTGLCMAKVASDGVHDTYQMMTDEEGAMLRLRYLEGIDKEWRGWGE